MTTIHEALALAGRLTRGARRRRDVSGDVTLAADLLARAAVARMGRGASHAAVHAWVLDERQIDRFGPLAALSVAALFTGGVA